MCLTLRKQCFKRIFRLVVPFANWLGNLRLAYWPANLQIGQIGRLDGTYASPFHKQPGMTPSETFVPRLQREEARCDFN